MKINTYALVSFIFVWAIPTFLVIREYVKMDKEDKKSAINDFKSRRFIFTGGFLLLGAFLAHLGSLFTLNIVGVIGGIFVVLGGIVSTVNLWNKSRNKSILMIILIAVFSWSLLI
ncbi:hypothetical protein [Psychrobacillus sp. NPDC093180]|uniref:hypothetical protein n=1 Tax=Psychrobacillus sp. NPDC093180 TaxID=3364489 RepID=UPI0038129C55